MRISTSAFLIAAMAVPVYAESPKLGKPIQLKAGGNSIDVEIGHAAPFVGDFDGDGRRDLLVGQFGDGKLRIYLNEGSNQEPKFGEMKWFMAGGAEGKVPSG